MCFRHRKLMDESEPPTQSVNSTMTSQTFNGTLSAVCEPFCNPLINDSGYCLSPCLGICPTNCHFTIPPPDYSVPSDFYPPPAPPPASNHRVPALLIAAFVALSLAALIVLGYVVYSRLYCRRGNRGGGRSRAQPQRAVPPQDDEFVNDLGPVLDHPIWYIHTIGLPPSVIGKITVCKYKRAEGLIEGTECSVCLTEFEEDETVRLLPKCSHAFHVPCIDRWLQSHTNCPNCRALIITGGARSPSPEPSGNNLFEEIRLNSGRDDIDLGRETDSAPQNRVETEPEAEELNAGRLEVVVDESKNGMQPIRRSVSVDSLSAARINLAVAHFLLGKSTRKSDSESGDEENQDARNKSLADSSSSSIGRSVQFLSGSSSAMKRSLSGSGRFLTSKHNRTRGSVLPQ